MEGIVNKYKLKSQGNERWLYLNAIQIYFMEINKTFVWGLYSLGRGHDFDRLS